MQANVNKLKRCTFIRNPRAQRKAAEDRNFNC